MNETNLGNICVKQIKEENWQKRLRKDVLGEGELGSCCFVLFFNDGIFCVTQADLKLEIFLPQPSK
jgi:hypothetical protein